MRKLIFDEERFRVCCTVESDESLTTDFEFWVFEKIEEFDDSDAEGRVKGSTGVGGIRQCETDCSDESRSNVP